MRGREEFRWLYEYVRKEPRINIRKCTILLSFERMEQRGVGPRSASYSCWQPWGSESVPQRRPIAALRCSHRIRSNAARLSTNACCASMSVGADRLEKSARSVAHELKIDERSWQTVKVHIISGSD